VKNSLGSNWPQRTPTLNIEWGQIDPKGNRRVKIKNVRVWDGNNVVILSYMMALWCHTEYGYSIGQAHPDCRVHVVSGLNPNWVTTGSFCVCVCVCVCVLPSWNLDTSTTCTTAPRARRTVSRSPPRLTRSSAAASPSPSRWPSRRSTTSRPNWRATPDWR